MLVQGSPEWQGPPIDQGSGGGDNGDMESRIKDLEKFAKETGERLMRIETRMELEMATKSDIHTLEVTLHKELTSQTWKFVTWMTGVCTLLVGATYFIANHAK